MKIGINIRVMGEQSTPGIIQRILTSADQAGIDSAWIVDHIAIPPEDSEGSGGRYLDPLSTLAWMAGQTKHWLILDVDHQWSLITFKANRTLNVMLNWIFQKTKVQSMVC